MADDAVVAADTWWTSRTERRRLQIHRLAGRPDTSVHPPVAGQLAIAMPSVRRHRSTVDSGKAADRWWYSEPPDRRAQIWGWLADDELPQRSECEGQLEMPAPRQRHHTAERN